MTWESQLGPKASSYTSLLNKKFSIGINLISQKVIDSYDIKKDIDTFEG